MDGWSPNAGNNGSVNWMGTCTHWHALRDGMLQIRQHPHGHNFNEKSLPVSAILLTPHSIGPRLPHPNRHDGIGHPFLVDRWNRLDSPTRFLEIVPKNNRAFSAEEK
jgi:hypothetical protein